MESLFSSLDIYLEIESIEKIYIYKYVIMSKFKLDKNVRRNIRKKQKGKGCFWD